MEAVINLFDKYHSQIIILLLGVTCIVMGLMVWIWISNKRKYHNLKHQIPAYVVKNYLDSIIQNSSALKSSLFRGGGIDIDPASIPSVMPVDHMNSESQVAVDLSGVAGDEALKAEVSRLQSELNNKNNTIRDLEGSNTDLGGQVKNKQERIEELEAQLANSDSGGTADEDVLAELEAVKTHRDQIQEELDGYGMIQDDLANLKRLKQENAQLKAALEQTGGDVPDEAVAEAEELPVEDTVAESNDMPVGDAMDAFESTMDEVATEEPVAEEVVEETSFEEPAATEAMEEPEEVAASAEQPVEEEAEAEPVEAAAAESEEEQTENKSDDKSPEDLLSEFEKMLG